MSLMVFPFGTARHYRIQYLDPNWALLRQVSYCRRAKERCQIYSFGPGHVNCPGPWSPLIPFNFIPWHPLTPVHPLSTIVFMPDEREGKTCALREQGFSPGSCWVSAKESKALACQATLRKKKDGLERMISAIHLSRPENYLSIYQSGGNFSCRKCHSWYFS